MKPNSKLPLILIFITLLIDVIGIGIIIPILPKLLKELGAGDLSEASMTGGWIMVAFALPQFIFSPIMGGLSDRFGRRPVLIISLLGLGIDYVIHAVAPTVSILFAGRVLAGICGASFTTASSYIADISTPEKRAQNFGLIGMAFGFGFILGPVFGGLAGSASARLPFWISACLSLANALLCFFLLPESLDKANRRPFEWKRANPVGSFKQMKNYPMVSKLMLPLFLLYLASHAVQSNWSFYTKEKFNWDEKMIGYSLGMVGIMVAIVQGGLIRIILPKLGNEKSILGGFLLYCLGMIGFGIADQSWMMFAITVIYCLSGISGPAIQGEMSQSVPPNAQGELSGAMTALMSLSTIIGPPLMNGIFSHFTDKSKAYYFPGAAMFFGAFLTAVSFVVVYSIYRNKARLLKTVPATESLVGEE